MLLYKSLKSDAGYTLIWCENRNPLCQNFAREPQQSQARLPTELPREMLACLFFSYLCWAVCTIPSGTFKTRHCCVPTTVSWFYLVREVKPLCRSCCSLLSFPKPSSSLLQDSLCCVLEFVCACVCSCAFSSKTLVPLENMTPCRSLKPMWRWARCTSRTVSHDHNSTCLKLI